VIAYLEQSRKDLRARTAKDATDHGPVVYAGGIGFKGTQGIESTDADYLPFEWTGTKNGSRSLGGREHFFADRERLLSLNPDVIFLDAAGLSLLLQDYGKKPDYYRALKAFKTDRVYVLYPFNFYTTNIECVLADAYAVGKILYPRSFSDIDPRKKADEIFRIFVGVPVNDRMEKDFGVLGRRLVLPTR
jgi:iron complex transport system substrate-binding protein